MKPRMPVILLAGFVLHACSSTSNPYGTNGTYGQMNNDRFFGYVVSETQGISPSGAAVGAVKGAVGTSATSVISAPPTSTTMVAGSPLTYANPSAMASSALTQLPQGLYNYVAGTSSSDNTTLTIHYVIQKDDGQRIAIDQDPENDEPICFPGQRVMMQYNGQYLHVYKSDVEDPLPRHVPGAPRVSG